MDHFQDHSYQGHLLVASPHMSDSSFAQTVILMLQHDHQGALGVILNRPSDNKVQDIWHEVSDDPCAVDDLLFLGGPLRGPLIALHNQGDLSADQVVPGTFYSMQRDSLCQLVSDANSPLRLFSGYAGWSGGQLEEELKTGSWLTIPAREEFIFCQPHDDLWKAVVTEISNEVLFSTLNIKHIPDDPSLN